MKFNQLAMTNKQGKKVKNNHYDSFVRRALQAGFTDDQIDFLWDELCLERKVFLNKDNYLPAPKQKGKK